MDRHCVALWAVVVSLGLGTVLAAQSVSRTDSRQQPVPTFRTGVTAVPIDVRVIDRDGKPITDLKREDFVVFEDDSRQRVVHFSQHLMTAETPGPPLRARAEVPEFEPVPQSHRIFLIVIGAGALGSQPLGPGSAKVADPSKSLDGLQRLVREWLLPQDQIALLAYNYASDFSTDHEKVAGLLESFRESDERGLAAMRQQSMRTPAHVPAQPTSAVPGAALFPDSDDLGFSEYVNARNRSTSDAENLRFGIRYLRFMEGEKHLLYLTEKGILEHNPGTPETSQRRPADDLKQLGSAASDARVALHVIQTGGIPSDPGPFQQPLPVMTPKVDLRLPGLTYFGMLGTTGSNAASSSAGSGTATSAAPQPGWDRPAPDPAVPIPGMNAAGLRALRDLGVLAEQTGGQASILSDAGRALAQIDLQTRAEYLLSYYTSNSQRDGRYRTVRVEVNRPGATVLYRHGYYADQPAAVALSRRTVAADGRLGAALSSTRRFSEVGVTGTASFAKAPKGKGGDVRVHLSIDPTSLRWTTDDLSRRVVHLDLMVLCGDAGEKIVGQTRRMLDVTLTEERFERVAKEGLPYEVTVPVGARPTFLKVAVYNFEANIVGTTVVKLAR